MFGYVNANLGQLSPEDQSTYKGFYCGLCRTLKQTGGTRSQMLLNYDMTFLAILLNGLYEPEVQEETFSCKVHPGKKMHSLTSNASEYAADMDIILGYYNLLDDYEDTGNPARKALADLIRPVFERAQEKWSGQAEAVSKALRQLSEAEKRNESNIDEVSAFTGDMIAAVFCWRENDIFNADLARMGFFLGKFIYMMDAYEDRKQDVRKKCYNPLIAFYQHCGSEAQYEAAILQMLKINMTEAAASFERLPIIEYAPILRNILYSGVWTKYEKIQSKAGRKSLDVSKAGGDFALGEQNQVSDDMTSPSTITRNPADSAGKE